MTRSTNSLRSIAPLLVLLTALAGCAQEQPESGAFVVRLGTDTVGVERYTRTAERMEATAVTRSPAARIRQSVITFGPDGSVERYESQVRDAATPADAPYLQRTLAVYSPDSAVVETTEDGETRRQVMAARPRMIPSSIDHFSFEELVIRSAPGTASDTVYRPGDPPSAVVVQRIGADSVALQTESLGVWRARVDSADRILAMHAGALGRTVQRVTDLDVEAIARRWADEDARGAGMGPLSPRDTLVATVGDAQITVDYSRPAKRGRPVFGGLVPLNEVWRTGANAATQLTTDRALAFGATRVPAGTYTLFTIPRRDGWTLIVNRETGQAGTDYDSAQDLARLTMQVDTLASPVERFTISVEETEGGGALALSWDQTRAWIPLSVVRSSR